MHWLAYNGVNASCAQDRISSLSRTEDFIALYKYISIAQNKNDKATMRSSVTAMELIKLNNK